MSEKSFNNQFPVMKKEKSTTGPILVLIFLATLFVLLIIAGNNMGASGLAVVPVLILILIGVVIDLVVLIKRISVKKSGASKIMLFVIAIPLWFILNMVLFSIWDNMIRCSVGLCRYPYSGIESAILKLDGPVIASVSFLITLLVVIRFYVKK